MWIVRNTLKATVTLRGLDVSIPAGDQFDLDSIGRDRAEGSNQIQVAFEEGYFENVFKGARGEQAAPRDGGARSPIPGLSAAHFDSSLAAFKQEVLRELRAQLPGGLTSEREDQLAEMRAALSKDMQEVVGELKLIRTRFEDARGRVKDDTSLSDAEVRARLAFLEEQEQRLLKNFETIGRQVEVEQDDSDVMNKADLLADL